MKKLLLILIFVLALFLRVYKLGQYPVGFLWDEAGLGYNAYSILKTGRDEYGKILPLIFKSFGDYKPGFYVYLTVPFVAIFGLNEFAVRLPSALFGASAIFLMYLLVKENQRLTRMKERLPADSAGIYADSVPLIAALLLTINPWHINFSRGAWELNVMLTEIVLSLFLFMRFFNTRKLWQFYLGMAVLISSLFTYQSAKLLMPVIFAGFVFFFRGKISLIPKKDKKRLLVIIIFAYLVFSLVTFVSGKAGRLKVMSVFSYPRSEDETNMILKQDNGNRLDFAIFHSAPIFFTRSVLSRYFNHFSGKFLFISGDWSNQRNGVIYQGEMYYLDLIFLAFGLAYLFSRKRNLWDNFMLFWLLLAPVPAALTRDSISSVRSFIMVIPLIYISAIGINVFLDALRKEKAIVYKGVIFLLIVAYGFLFVRFLDLYFVHDPKFTSENRLYGYKKAMAYVNSLGKNKNKIIFTNKYGQPYIFYLFYSQYDPVNYQKEAFLKENPFGDVGEVERIDNIEFRKIYFPDDQSNKNSLFIGDEFDLPIKDIVGQEKIAFLKEVQFLNGKTAFRIVETR